MGLDPTLLVRTRILSPSSYVLTGSAEYPVTSVDKDGNLTVVDEGASDKRLLAMESEWAGPLKMMTREGNTLSAILWQAWDGGKLQTLTRNSPLKATDPHVSIIGHVTREEVLRHVSENDTSNGFANRFLWLIVKRSRILPIGEEWSKVDCTPLVKRLSEALQFARSTGELTWGDNAKAMWSEVYAELSEGESGLFGAATSRAEAQVLRLCAVYAVMDLSRTIKADHLKGALAVWEYAEDCARFIFGDATGDQVADKILELLKDAASDGLTRNEIRNLFSRHRSSDRIGHSLERLEGEGRIRRESEPTGAARSKDGAQIESCAKSAESAESTSSVTVSSMLLELFKEKQEWRCFFRSCCETGALRLRAQAWQFRDEISERHLRDAIGSPSRTSRMLCSCSPGGCSRRRRRPSGIASGRPSFAGMLWLA